MTVSQSPEQAGPEVASAIKRAERTRPARSVPASSPEVRPVRSAPASPPEVQPVRALPPVPERRISAAQLNVAINRALVTAYKLVGFLVLTTILVGITAFVGVHTFYLVHDAWVVPRIISPGDPEVLELRGRLAEETWKRQSLQNERLEVQARLDRLRAIAGAERAFREGLPDATALRRETLAALEAARAEQQRVSQELSNIAASLQASSRDQLERDFQAKLITEQQLLEGTYQLAQLAQARASLTERELELSERIRRLSQEVDALETASAGGAPSAELRSADAGGVAAVEAAAAPPTASGEAVAPRPSYEGLLLRREHARARVEASAALAEVEVLEASLAGLDRAIEQYDELLAHLRADPLLAASTEPLVVAFVAYEGESSVPQGTGLYGCHLALLWCERVGRVMAHLPGEHAQSHPVYGRELRGRWVHIEIEDTSWAKADILHANRPPLFL